MSTGLTHLVSIRGLKFLPCYKDRWLPAVKWFFCSKR